MTSIPLFRVSQHLGHKLAEDIGGLLVTHRHCSNIDTAQTARLRGSSCRNPTMSPANSRSGVAYLGMQAQPKATRGSSDLHVPAAALPIAAAQIGEVNSRKTSRVLCRPHVPDWLASSCI